MNPGGQEYLFASSLQTYYPPGFTTTTSCSLGWRDARTRWLFAPVLSGPAMPIKEITNPSLPIVRSGNLCKPRGPCVLSAGVVSLLISSFKLLAHPSSLDSRGYWLFVPYSSVIPCHGGLQPPFKNRLTVCLLLVL